MPRKRKKPETFLLPGKTPLEILIRRNARAKSLKLNVRPLQGGRAEIVLPPNVNLQEAREFALEQEAWLRGELARVPSLVVPKFGVRIPIEGKPLRLRNYAGKQVRRSKRSLYCPGPEDRLPQQIRSWLMKLAFRRAAGFLSELQLVTPVHYTKLRVRDTTSVWGSCSSSGKIMISWRLAMAPRPVLHHVVSHELAHLCAPRGHGPEFYAEWERLCPDYRRSKAWLRKNGVYLHRYYFG